MSSLVSIQIQRAVYDKLRRLAVLTGDESSAIEKLISHWEQGTAAIPANAKSAQPIEIWHSPTGDILRVGEELEGSYGGETFEATVVADGIRFRNKTYSSPTAAAQAVKAAKGVTGTAARTNGRDFWKVRDAETNRWVSISSLRPAHKVDLEAVKARFRALAASSPSK